MITRLALLSRNGLPDLPTSAIQPHRQGLGRWRIKFSYEASEPFSMSSAQATELAGHLRQMDEIEMADEIDTAVQRADRYQSM
jgi:hypothetical protein